ncbi:tandem-95 repeat protein [Candidatus Woesearchaeota archaeon]|nr:tandem-95 repeat protein [Candidatus Woesearchaeota archaeon]
MGGYKLKKRLLFIVILLVILSVSLVSAEVVINEFVYDHSDCNDNYCELIELYNNGSYAINLSTYTLCGDDLIEGYINETDSSTIYNNGAILNASGYAIVTDGGSGSTAYGNFSVNINFSNIISLHVDASAMCGNDLSNTGEEINITNGTYTDHVTYSSAWGASSNSYSLERISPYYITNTSANWNQSKTVNGTPGYINSVYDVTGPVISGENTTPVTIYNNVNVSINATINDSTNISAVWVEGNWNGSFVNYTLSLNDNGKYNYTINSANLSNQETVYWRYYANDTVNNLAVGALQNFTVQNREPQLAQDMDNFTWPEDTVYSFNINGNFTDADGDNMTWNATATENITIAINQTTGIVNLTPKGNFTGAEYINFSAYDGINRTLSNTLKLNVTNVNDAPILASIGNYTLPQDQQLTIQLSAIDIDPTNDSLTYGTDAAFGALNSTTGVFTWTPNSSYHRDYTVIFNVSDGNGGEANETIGIFVYSTLNITDVDVAINPAYNNIRDGYIIQNVYPGQRVATTITVYNKNAGSPTENNIDHANITLSVDNFGVSEVKQLTDPLTPASSDTETISFNVPTLIGEGLYTVSIETEGYDHYPVVYRYGNFTYYINITRQTDNVTIENATLNATSIQCESPLNLTVNVTNKGRTDFDDVNVTLTQSSLGISLYEVLNMTSNTSQTVYFAIDTANKPAGSYSLNVLVKYYSDTLQDSKTATLAIINCEPQNTSIIPNITIEEDGYNDTINLSNYFADYNNDNLIFSKEGASNITFTFLSNGIVNITPKGDFNGTNYLNFTASDTINTTKSNQVKITVTPVNDPAAVTAIPDQTAAQDSEFIYAVIASDVENDTLIYNLTVNASIKARINSSGYIYNWTPTNSEVGNIYVFNVSVNDTRNKTYEDFKLTITNVNDAPVFNTAVPIRNLTWPEDTTNSSLNISGSFYDIDGDSLAYEASGVSDITASIDSNGIVTLTPAANFNGTRNITFRAYDGSLYSNYSNTVKLNVTNVNDAPAIGSFSPSTTAVVGETYDYDVNATDIDGDTITYYDNTTLFNINSATGIISFTPAIGDIGSHTINISASDGQLNDSKLFTLNVYNTLSLTNAQTSINDAAYSSLSEGATLSGISQGDSLKVKVDVKNWLSTYDMDLVRVSATIIDGSTLVATNYYDISTLGKESTATATINLGAIGSSIANGNYDLRINATAQYNPSSPTKVNSTWNASVRIQSEAHQILITSAVVGPASIACNRSIVVNVTVKNLDAFNGNQNTTVTVTKTSLGINKAETKEINYGAAEIFSIPINVSQSASANNYTLSIHAETEEGTTADTTKNLEINACEITYNPAEASPILSGKTNKTFSFALPAELSLISSVWKENGVEKSAYQNSLNYTFEAKNTNGDYHIIVEITDDQGASHTHEWYPITTMYAIADPYTTAPDLSALNQSQLENVTLTLNNENAKIEFLEPVNLSDIVTLGDHLYIQGSIAAVNVSGDYFVFSNKPAKITLTGLTYNEEPKIYYTSTFTTDSSQITSLCPTTICSLVSRTEPPTNGDGVVVFNVTQFSSYRIGTTAAPTTNPVAVAGSDQTVIVNSVVTLDGSGSYDEDGTIASYAWAQTSGTTVTLNNANNDVATFTPSQTGTYIFGLTVTDDDGLTNTDSITVDVQTIAIGNLTISDLDVKVDGSVDKNIEGKAEGYKISEEAKPGSDIELNIQIENLFDEDTDMEIKDIEVIVTIEEIDDGDDLEEDADEFDLDAGDKEKITLNFNIPDDAEEDVYDVVIEADGDDDNGNTHSITKTLKLEVKRKKHEIKVTNIDLAPSVVDCSKTARLDVEIKNIGKEDEEDVTLEIKSSELSLNIEEKDIELDSDTDDDSEYTQTATVNVPADLPLGTYPITIKTYYDDKASDTETINLLVAECKIGVGEEAVELTTTKGLPTEGEGATAEELPTAKISFRESDEYILILALAFLILTGAVIFVIGALVIKLKK